MDRQLLGIGDSFWTVTLFRSATEIEPLLGWILEGGVMKGLNPSKIHQEKEGALHMFWSTSTSLSKKTETQELIVLTCVKEDFN